VSAEASGNVRLHVIVAAVAAVAAMVLFVLLLRDTVVVELARGLDADTFRQYVLVATTGASGVVGCGLAAMATRWVNSHWLLAGGFAVAAGAMLTAFGVDSWVRLVAFANLAALAAGWLTVVLSLVLRAAVGSKKLGVWIGLGVGIAFAVFSAPQVYRATVANHVVLATIAAAAGVVAAVLLRPQFAATSFSPDYQPRIWLTWIVILLVLVWMDKAALFVIRAAAVQNEFQWGGWWSQWSTACLHFLIAGVAGAAFDRGRAAGMLLLALVLLLAACMLSHNDTRAYAAAEVFYALGASIYVTALVFYPSRGGRPWYAAGVLAIARWAGGALGIAVGLAFGGVPNEWLMAIALIGALAIWERARLRAR
jgi:hypothetical protein